MEITNLINYVLNNYENDLVIAANNYLKEGNNSSSLLFNDVKKIQLVTISLFPKTEWFTINNHLLKFSEPRLFNVAWCKIQFVLQTDLANGVRRHSDVIHLYLDGDLDSNLLALFNSAARMEPLLIDTLTRCYNAIIFDDYPGLRPLLHGVTFKFYHEWVNDRPPSLVFAVQWPELVLLKEKRSSFELKKFIKLDSIKAITCQFTAIIENQSFQFQMPLSQHIHGASITKIIEKVALDNVVVPLFVYESIIYGDVLFSKKNQDDYEINLIRENGAKLCDHRMQQVEFLPISPIFADIPALLPLRLESQEESEKIVINFLEP
jgi:hypothetical protein